MLVSKEGSVSKFIHSPSYTNECRKSARYFKLVDIAKDKQTPFIKSPDDKVNKYNVLLRSTYLNDSFFQKIRDLKMYQRKFQKQEERTELLAHLVDKLPAISVSNLNP